jgi:hypothetical protein
VCAVPGDLSDSQLYGVMAYGRSSGSTYKKQSKKQGKQLVILPSAAKPQQSVAVPTTQAVKSGPEPPKERVFAGFKARLIYDSGGTAVSTDVRYSKMERKDLFPTIIMKHAKTGQEVEYRPDHRYHYAYFIKGTDIMVDESEVRFYQVIDGKEKEVEKFQRTHDLKIEKTIPRVDLDAFLPDSYYQIWSDDPASLYKIASDLDRNDKVGVTRLSFGGFKQYYGLIYPTQFGDEFGLTMMLTVGRKKFDHLMPVKAGAAVKAEEKEIKGVLEEI